MELDLQSLFGLHVHSFAVLIAAEAPQPPPPHLGSYRRALLVGQDRRHLFVTPCIPITYSSVGAHICVIDLFQQKDISLGWVVLSIEMNC
jgi:hypothetical protein